MTLTRRRIFWFFIATFVLSWAGIVGNRIWPASAWQAPVSPYGPLLAALLVIGLTEGRDGLRRWWGVWKNFRAPAWLYAASFLVPIGMILASLGVASLSGVTVGPLPERDWSEFLILVPILLLNGPLQEAPSFRGYAQQELERDMTPLTAAVLVGVGVLIWHAPFFVLMSHVTSPPLALGIIGASVVYAWMLKTGGSVWPIVLAHLSVNYFGGAYLGRTITQPSDNLIYIGLLSGCYVVLAVLLVWRCGPELRARSLTPAPAARE